jgi:rfaE bifunctional protein nucleotidyltransferase chain/domain
MTTSQEKIVLQRASLAERIGKLARPIVFTNGCFDILHRGHVAYLEDAAGLGASLVVGINSDASVRRLEKGTDRPINPLDDRMAIVAALGCVSLVAPFDEDTPLELIKIVKPDHLVKGGDWSIDQIVGADFVTANGGEVHSIPFKYNRSTTDLLERIREHR